MKSQELLALHKLDERSLSLQKKGKYLEALEIMEKALVLRKHFFGIDSPHVWKSCKTVAELCNLLAMTSLQNEKPKQALILLKKAQLLSQRDEVMQAITFNNLACYYRRQGNLHSALKCLEAAINIENQIIDERATEVNKADTLLNISAVLSQLGRHASALQQAQSALILLQEEIFPELKSTLSPVGIFFDNLKNHNKIINPNRAAVLCIAYHNVGIEEEFLQRYENAASTYSKGLILGKKYLPKDHGVIDALKRSLYHINKFSRNSVTSKSIVYTHGKCGRRLKVDKKKWKGLRRAYGNIATITKPITVSKPRKAQLIKINFDNCENNVFEAESKCEQEIDLA